MKLHWQIAIALAAALLAGNLVGDVPWFLKAADFVGKIFLNALKMLIVPLIVAAIIVVAVAPVAVIVRSGWGAR